MPLGVFGERALVLDQDGSDDRRLVGVANVRQMIWDEAKLLVGIRQRVGSLGHGDQRQSVVGILEVILDHVRQTLELLGQVGVLRCVDLGEFELERGEFFVDSIESFRCDLFRAVMEEFRYL